MMQNMHMEFSLKTKRSVKSNLLVQITSYYIINETIQLAPSLLFFHTLFEICCCTLVSSFFML